MNVPHSYSPLRPPPSLPHTRCWIHRPTPYRGALVIYKKIETCCISFSKAVESVVKPRLVLLLLVKRCSSSMGPSFLTYLNDCVGLEASPHTLPSRPSASSQFGVSYLTNSQLWKGLLLCLLRLPVSYTFGMRLKHLESCHVILIKILLLCKFNMCTRA